MTAPSSAPSLFDPERAPAKNSAAARKIGRALEALVQEIVDRRLARTQADAASLLNLTNISGIINGHYTPRPITFRHKGFPALADQYAPRAWQRDEVGGLLRTYIYGKARVVVTQPATDGDERPAPRQETRADQDRGRRAAAQAMRILIESSPLSQPEIMARLGVAERRWNDLTDPAHLPSPKSMLFMGIPAFFHDTDKDGWLVHGGPLVAYISPASVALLPSISAMLAVQGGCVGTAPAIAPVIAPVEATVDVSMGVGPVSEAEPAPQETDQRTKEDKTEKTTGKERLDPPPVPPAPLAAPAPDPAPASVPKPEPEPKPEPRPEPAPVVAAPAPLPEAAKRWIQVIRDIVKKRTDGSSNADVCARLQITESQLKKMYQGLYLPTPEQMRAASWDQALAEWNGVLWARRGGCVRSYMGIGPDAPLDEPGSGSLPDVGRAPAQIEEGQKAPHDPVSAWREMAAGFVKRVFVDYADQLTGVIGGADNNIGSAPKTILDQVAQNDKNLPLESCRQALESLCDICGIKPARPMQKTDRLARDVLAAYDALVAS